MSNIDIVSDNKIYYVQVDSPNIDSIDIKSSNANDINIDVIDNGLTINSTGSVNEVNNLSDTVTWATVPDAYISESSVTQHESAITITESQISDLQTYLTEHPVISAATSSDTNSDNTFIQNLTLDTNGHIIGLTTGTATTSPSATFDVISFNIDDDSILTKGQISWDDTEGTMDIGLTDTTTIHVGEHRFYRVRNRSGNTLYKGQVVYATGVHSNGLIIPNLYIANDSIDEVRFIGTVLEDINHNNNGYVIDFGHLQNLDLDGSARPYAVGDETWVAGDILYAHPTVAGKLTNIEPKHALTVAIILDAGNGNGNGSMFVRPSSYGDLGDNHDIDLSGLINGHILRYDSSTEYWKAGVLYDNGTAIGIHTNAPTAALDIDSDILRLRSSKTPTSATDSGNAGDIAWDSGYIYVCVASNTWKRSALNTW